MLHAESLPLVILFSKDLAKVAFIKKTLSDCYSILQTTDPEELVKWITSSAIDVIIIDEPLLEGNDFSLLERIMKIHIKPAPVTLLITNKLQKSFVLSAINAGISEFLREPLSKEEILERITLSLKSRCVSKKIPFVTSNIKKGSKQAKDSLLLQHRFIATEKSLTTLLTAAHTELPIAIAYIQISTSLPEMDRECDKAIKKHVEQLLRPQDILMGEGRGHYLLLLPKTSSRAADILTNDLQSELLKNSITIKGKQIFLKMTLSIECFTKESLEEESHLDKLHKILNKVKKSLEKAPKPGNKMSSDT
jgi:DNA-binding NarL/FixJ family response regulator